MSFGFDLASSLSPPGGIVKDADEGVSMGVLSDANGVIRLLDGDVEGGGAERTAGNV